MSRHAQHGGDQPMLVDQLDGLSLGSGATTCSVRSRYVTDCDGAQGRRQQSFDISQSACDVRMRRGLEANVRNNGGGGAGDGPRGSPSMTSSAASGAGGGCNNVPARNYSFTRTQLRDIERSNQILVQRISTSKPSDAVQRSVSTTNLLVNHIAPATINRRRQQQQIDAGNEMMQKRLARIAQRRRSTTNK